MNTANIGDLGESVAIMKFTQMGCIVSKPLTNNARYDLIVEYNNKLYKVQVKTTQAIKENVKMEFSIKTTNYSQGSWKSTGYTNNEIDLFFLYCIENNWCGLYTNENGEFQKNLTLRLVAPKNNQTKGIRLAEDYQFDNKFGELA